MQTEAGRGERRGLRAEVRTEEGRASPPSQFRLPASPEARSVPEPAQPRRGRCWCGVEGGGPGVLP